MSATRSAVDRDRSTGSTGSSTALCRLGILIALVIWALGLVDLAGYVRLRPGGPGRSSPAFIAVAVSYGGLFPIGLALLGFPRSLMSLVGLVQRRWWLAVPALLASAMAMRALWRWAGPFPLLQLSLIALIALASATLLLAGWRRAGSEQRWRRAVLLPVCALLATELCLQGLAFVGLLPGLNISAHLPYARVYWTAEGHGNGITNRYGWYYPEFKLAEGSERIVAIGDSFVEALQVYRSENLGVLLGESLERAGRRDTEVLSLGISAYGPAQYLEILKYAVEYYQPKEAILFVFLGNDFRDVLLDRADYAPRDYVFHTLDANGQLALYPESTAAWRDLRRNLKRTHLPLAEHLREILDSHFLTAKALQAIAPRVRELASRGVATAEAMPSSRPGGLSVPPEPHPIFRFLGAGSVFPFEKRSGEQARRAFRIVKQLLERCHDYAVAHGVTLRIVSIPHFPDEFYSRYRRRAWSPVIDQYDLFLPERTLVGFARRHGIPMLPMGRYMRDHRLTVEEIRALYFYSGLGHLSPVGHEYFASAIAASFYPEKSRDQRQLLQ